MSYQTDSSRWRAVQSRDEHAASAFVYAVATTKIFCRPSCPSRLARRANVCFYDTVEAAVIAGYRPCRRCKPDQLSASHLDHKAARREVVEKACRFIEEADIQAKSTDVAEHVRLSPRYLHGLFKDIMGMTPAKYAQVFKSSQALNCLSGTPPEHRGCAAHTPLDPLLFDADSLGLSGTLEADWQASDPSRPVQSHFASDNLCLGFPPKDYEFQGPALPLNEFDLLFDESYHTTLSPKRQHSDNLETYRC